MKWSLSSRCPSNRMLMWKMTLMMMFSCWLAVLLFNKEQIYLAEAIPNFSPSLNSVIGRISYKTVSPLPYNLVDITPSEFCILGSSSTEDNDDEFLFRDSDSKILRKYNAASKEVSIYLGKGLNTSEGAEASSVKASVRFLTQSNDGECVFIDSTPSPNKLRVISKVDNTVRTITSISNLWLVAFDEFGNIYTGENFKIRKLYTNGTFEVIGGNGLTATTIPLDGASATGNRLKLPTSMFAVNDTVYFTMANSIMKIHNGSVYTISGSWANSCNFNATYDGPASKACLITPKLITIINGEIYFTDNSGAYFRKINQIGAIELIFGLGGEVIDLKRKDQLLQNVAISTAGMLVIPKDNYFKYFISLSKNIVKVDKDSRIQYLVGNIGIDLSYSTYKYGLQFSLGLKPFKTYRNGDILIFSNDQYSIYKISKRTGHVKLLITFQMKIYDAVVDKTTNEDLYLLNYVENTDYGVLVSFVYKFNIYTKSLQLIAGNGSLTTLYEYDGQSTLDISIFNLNFMQFFNGTLYYSDKFQYRIMEIDLSNLTVRSVFGVGYCQGYRLSGMNSDALQVEFDSLDLIVANPKTGTLFLRTPYFISYIDHENKIRPYVGRIDTLDSVDNSDIPYPANQTGVGDNSESAPMGFHPVSNNLYFVRKTKLFEYVNQSYVGLVLKDTSVIESFTFKKSNGYIYYSAGPKIYSYDPITKKVEIVVTENGGMYICMMSDDTTIAYAVKNTMYLTKYNIVTKTSTLMSLYLLYPSKMITYDFFVQGMLCIENNEIIIAGNHQKSYPGSAIIRISSSNQISVICELDIKQKSIALQNGTVLFSDTKGIYKNCSVLMAGHAQKIPIENHPLSESGWTIDENGDIYFVKHIGGYIKKANISSGYVSDVFGNGTVDNTPNTFQLPSIGVLSDVVNGSFYGDMSPSFWYTPKTDQYSTPNIVRGFNLVFSSFTKDEDLIFILSDSISSYNVDCVRDKYGYCLQNFTCFGIFYNDDFSCSGRGDCTLLDFCECFDNYYSENCSLTTCYNLMSNESNVCSGHGECVDFDNCKCNENYYGYNCSVTSCFGTFSNESNVCSGNGSCLDTDLCQCNGNYSGLNCNETLCNNHNLNISNNSSLYNDSSLNYNYTSYENTTNINNFTNTNNSSMDSNSNSTNLNNSLTSNSSIADNSTNLSNSTLIDQSNSTLNNTCGFDCNNTSLGSNTTINISNNTTINNYTSGENNTIITNSTTLNTRNETFISNNSLILNSTNALDNSTVYNNTNNSIVNNSTSFNNTILNTNSTVSNITFNNSTLSFNSSLNSTISNTTNSNSNVTSDSLNNSTSLFGDNSTLIECYGRKNNDSGVCSGNGKCISNNTCQCTSMFEGLECEKKKITCFGFEQTDPMTCLGHGSCSSENTCQCDDGYFGSRCFLTVSSQPNFNSLGNTLEFHINSSIVISNGVLDCNKVVAEGSVAVLGKNPSCYWNDDNFFIELGGQYSLTPNSNILLNIEALDINGLQKSFISLVVAPSKSPTKPIVDISYKNVISSCEQLLIDASGSYCGDLKPVKFIWTIETSPDANFNLQQVSFDNLNSVLSSNNISISGKYVFGLIVESSLTAARSEKQFIEIIKSSIPNPSLYLLTNKLSLVNVEKSSLPIVVKKSIELPSCYFENKQFDYIWKQVSGPANVNYQIDSNNDLVITEILSNGDESYSFSVTAVSKFNSNSNATLVIPISSKSADLILNIYVSNLNINQANIIVESSDPDNVDSLSESWSWSCFERLSNQSCQDATVLNILSQCSTSKSLTCQLPNGSLSKVTLSMNIQKGLRSISKSLDIDFPKSELLIPPVISLISVTPNRFKVLKDELLSLQLSVILGGDEKHTNEEDIKREWLINGNSLTSSMISKMVTDPPQSSSLILSLNDLLEGGEYEIEFKVSDRKNNLSSKFTYKFKIVKSPKSCLCTINPSSGNALETQFSFSCPGCQNAEKSIDFVFGFIDDKSGTKIPLYNLGEKFASYLPSPYASNSLNTFVDIVDLDTGASVSYIKPVEIKTPSASTITQIKNKVKTWQSYAASLLPSDSAKLIFNVATISRTSELMISKLTNLRMVNGQAYELRNEMLESMSDGFNERNPLELISDIQFRVYMFGLESLASNCESIDSLPFEKLFNSTEKLITMATKNTRFRLAEGVDKLCSSLLNSIIRILTADSNMDYGRRALDLMQKFISLRMRNYYVGQKDLSMKESHYSSVSLLGYRNQQEKKRITSDIGNCSIVIDGIDGSISNRIVLETSLLSVSENFGVSEYLKHASKVQTFKISDLEEIQTSTSFKPLTRIVNAIKNFNSNVNFTFNLGSTYNINAKDNLQTSNNTAEVVSLGCFPIDNISSTLNNTDCSITISGPLISCHCSKYVTTILIVEKTISNSTITQLESEPIILPRQSTILAMFGFFGLFGLLIVLIVLILVVLIDWLIGKKTKQFDSFKRS